MEKTNNDAEDSKAQLPQDSAVRISRLATASLIMGIYGLAFPPLLFALVIIMPAGSPISAILMIFCFLLWPVSSLGGLVSGILALDRVARSQSQTLAKQTAVLGIFASASAIVFVLCSMVIPTAL